MNSIVEHNVAMMLSRERGGMRSLFGTESMGGNAGTFEKMVCWAANFYYADSGRIVVFGNSQHIDLEIVRTHRKGIFRLAIDLKQRGVEGVIEVLPNGVLQGPGGKILLESAKAYNKHTQFTAGDFAA